MTSARWQFRRGSAAVLALCLLATAAGSASAWDGGNTAPVKTLAGASTGLAIPRGVAFDAAGRMYVATFEGTVTAYAADWASGNTAPIKTLTGAATGLNQPFGIAFDAAGRMYVANALFGGSTVTVYAADWASGNTAPIKTLTGAATGLNQPFGLAFDAAGRMYVANNGNDTVTAYAADWAGGNTAPTKTLSGVDTRLNRPVGVAFDAPGRMYVANEDATVATYAADWAGGNTAPVKRLAGAATGLLGATGLAFDAAGIMYVANVDGGTITAYAADWPSGDTAPIKTLAGAATGLSQPIGVAFDTAAQMYVTNSNVSGTVTAYASDGNPVAYPPVASGTGQVGLPLLCAAGAWSASPRTVTVAWTRNGTTIPGQTSPSYTPTGADLGAAIACTQTATLPPLLVAVPAASAPITVVPLAVGPTGATGPTGPTGPTGAAPLVAVFAPASLRARTGTRLKAVYAVSEATRVTLRLSRKRTTLDTTAVARAGTNATAIRLRKAGRPLPAGTYTLALLGPTGTALSSTKAKVTR